MLSAVYDETEAAAGVSYGNKWLVRCSGYVFDTAVTVSVSGW
jgi:hypothetical protein